MLPLPTAFEFFCSPKEPKPCRAAQLSQLCLTGLWNISGWKAPIRIMEFSSLLPSGPPKTKLSDLEHHSAAPWTLTGLGHDCIPGEPEICELQRAAHYCDKLSFMCQQSNSRHWSWASQQLSLHSRLHALHNLSHSARNYLLETLICFIILSTLLACKQILTSNSSSIHELQRFMNFKCPWSTLAPPVTQVSYKDF